MSLFYCQNLYHPNFALLKIDYGTRNIRDYKYKVLINSKIFGNNLVKSTPKYFSTRLIMSLTKFI